MSSAFEAVFAYDSTHKLSINGQTYESGVPQDLASFGKSLQLAKHAELAVELHFPTQAVPTVTAAASQACKSSTSHAPAWVYSCVPNGVQAQHSAWSDFTCCVTQGLHHAFRASSFAWQHIVPEVCFLGFMSNDDYMSFKTSYVVVQSKCTEGMATYSFAFHLEGESFKV